MVKARVGRMVGNLKLVRFYACDLSFTEELMKTEKECRKKSKKKKKKKKK